MSETKTFQIFRAGSFTTMGGVTLTFTASDLQTIASSYSESAHAAPLVLGHPQHDDPRYGTVKSLSVFGDALFATAEVNGELVELVRAKRYTGVSAAFYPPEAPNNPRFGAWYLRHVGFLGAMPPAVKGMSPPEFAEANPLIADALARQQVCFAEPLPAFETNPLIADAEARALKEAGYCHG